MGLGLGLGLALEWYVGVFEFAKGFRSVNFSSLYPNIGTKNLAFPLYMSPSFFLPHIPHSSHLTPLLPPKRPPPLGNQNRPPHLLPAKLHVHALGNRHGVYVYVPGGCEEGAHAGEGEVWDYDGGVAGGVVAGGGGVVMGVVMLVFVLVLVGWGGGVSVVPMSVVPMTVTMTMPMHGMIPLTTLHHLPLPISQHIPTLQKIINHQHPTGPQPLFQLPRRVLHVFEVVESEAHSCDVEVPPLGRGEVGRLGVGFVEEVAGDGGGGGGAAGGVGRDHVGRDVDGVGVGDVGGEGLGVS